MNPVLRINNESFTSSESRQYAGDRSDANTNPRRNFFSWQQTASDHDRTIPRLGRLHIV